MGTISHQRHVGDVADTVRGQLSFCIHMLNAYSECIDKARDEEAIEVLSDIYNRLGNAQEGVRTMVEAYQRCQEERYTTRNLGKRRVYF